MRPVILIALSFLLVACATTSVDTSAVTGLLEPVTARTAAYLAADPAANPAAFDAAVAALQPLTQGERVPAAEALPHVQAIAALHDTYVAADAGLDPVRRSTFLRSTRLLLAMFAEATAGL